MVEMNAADFLASLDSHVQLGKITNQERIFLLKEMPSILDAAAPAPNLSKSETSSKEIRITHYGNGFLEFISANYQRNYHNQKMSIEKWHMNTFTHRLGGKPAKIIYGEDTGSVVEESWIEYGKLNHDGDKPARIKYYRSGEKLSEEWFTDDTKHRDGDKPAEINYNRKGIIIFEGWSIKGLWHRDDDKPAIIKYYDNGNVSEESWRRSGKIFRKAGKPNLMTYTERGRGSYDERKTNYSV